MTYVQLTLQLLIAIYYILFALVTERGSSLLDRKISICSMLLRCLKTNDPCELSPLLIAVCLAELWRDSWLLAGQRMTEVSPREKGRRREREGDEEEVSALSLV